MNTRTLFRLPLLVASLLAAQSCVSPAEEVPFPDLHAEDDAEPHDVVFAEQDVDLLDRLAPDEDDGWLQTELFTAEAPFNRVGLRLDAEEAPRMQVRASQDDGATMGPWTDVEVTFSEEGAHNAQVDVPEGSTHAQVRMFHAEEALLTFLSVELFQHGEARDALLEVGPAVAEETQGLAATGVVVSKAAWGGRTDRCTSRHRPNRITVHHTVTPNNDSMSMPARMRQIQNYHMNTRGYCDVGYHFLVGQDGRVYQGRPELKLGAHAGGGNTNNAGVSFVGNYQSAGPPRAQFEAAARIIKALSREYGITLNRTNVKGHRQVGTTSTACPGNVLYGRLGELVTLAQGSSTGGNTGGSTGGSTGGGFCAGRTGTWCDAGAAVTCTNGTQVRREACTHGCEVMPSGTPDRCKAPPPVTTGSYDDVQPGHLAYTAVEKLRDLGALYGCGTRRFCPNQPITRELLANLISKVDRAAFTSPSAPLFTDVGRSHPFYAAVQEVGARTIITTCGAGKFCPGDPVTRAAAAVFFRRARGLGNLAPSTPSFSDVPRAHWAFGAIERARERGWVNGCTSGTYCPAEDLTRAQAAVIAVRAYGL